MHGDLQLIVRTVAIAIGIGILAQVIAHRARLPSIVFLLVFGVLVGPDGLGWIEPDVLGAGLTAIVTIAVALILFEGGLQLHYADLAAVGATVRNLVTVGAAVSVVGAATAAHYVIGFPWPLAFLFGAIVSVTGPTVIQPLLERVRVTRRVDTILRGEGILIDPIGAILTVVILELLASADSSIAGSLLQFLARMGIGIAIGLAGGWVIGRLLRVRRLVADELKNLVVLAGVLALFVASESLASESGLAAAVIAGMAVRREAIPQQTRLLRFKGELSVLLISLLFVLLSAYLPLATLQAVGWAGVGTVVLLMLVVRPINVLASTWSTNTTWRERLFLMWISPRGVVAISIASFIAIRLQSEVDGLARTGLTAADGEVLLALVFLTIAITVLVQGLSAGSVARALDVDAEQGNFAVVVGANPLGRAVAGLLVRHDWDVYVVDSNRRNVALARAEGLVGRVGNVLDRQVQEESQLDCANAILALTANQATNVLVARVAAEEHHVSGIYPLVVDLEKGTADEHLDEFGGELAFGRRISIEAWNRRLRDEEARPIVVDLGAEPPEGPLGELDLPDGVLPVLTLRNGQAAICHGGSRWTKGDRLVALATEGGVAGLGGRLGGVEEIEPGPEPEPAPAAAGGRSRDRGH